MNPNFIKAVKRLFPSAVPGRDFMVQDNVDGKGPFLASWNLPQDPPDDKAIADVMALPGPAVVDGATFLSRLTDDELREIYAAAASNMTLMRYIEIVRVRGDVDVNSKPAQAAKDALVTANLLTSDRADLIFAPP